MTFVAGGALKPIGGHILSHASATRMFLRKGRAEERVAKLVDSPDRPESEASYKLDEGGWADAMVLLLSSVLLPLVSLAVAGIPESRKFPDTFPAILSQYDPTPSPSKFPNGTIIPAYTGPGVDTFIREFGRHDLLSYMNKYWINQNAPNPDLWAHEFSKHATCTSTFDLQCYGSSYKKNQELINYFDATIRANHHFPTFDILAASGIVPSNKTSYTLAQFESAIAAQVGATPYLGCRSNGTVLTEVWYFNHVLGTEQYGTYKPIASTTTSSCSKTAPIWYYERSRGSERNVRK
ncbi:hypothetical protein H0H81_007452 [Sphagnurus paluster]|uniref:ribonuclease T2 n=1 Tax=Sphagnurus paluster TaxID=117069 RepID=A0A9P7GR67_9AGAR|nr:hypothetical protein H0H81_007452 [Sphagnurus paluster]